MPRQRKSFDRISGIKEPSLIVVAAEGEAAEQRYFLGIVDKLEEQGTQLKLLVLPPREGGHSAPKHVLKQLSDYETNFGLGEDDDLCLVIDRDRQSWTEEQIAWVAQECANKQYLLALSNPCFELWLLLHHVDVNSLSEKQKQEIYENKNDHLKKEVSRVKGGYKSSRLKLEDFWDFTDIAIARAKALDTEPQYRWPNTVGTRVYLIIEKIKQVFTAQ